MNDILMKKLEQAATQAGKIILSAQEDKKAVRGKEGHANFVTIYDRMVQEFLFSELKKALPEAAFVGEEDGRDIFDEKFERGYVFVIDPIDGTTNFINGLFPSTVSIGLLLDGRPYMGVVCNPYTGQIFSAERGWGAFENGKRIYTAEEKMEDSLVIMGTAPYYAELNGEVKRLFAYYLPRCADLRRTGSAAWDICMVASGRAGLYFEPRVSLWDYAAGACILTEAGGRLTDLQGKEMNFRGKSSIAAASAGAVRGGYLPPEKI